MARRMGMCLEDLFATYLIPRVQTLSFWVMDRRKYFVTTDLKLWQVA